MEVAAKKNEEAHRILDGVLAKEPNRPTALVTRGKLFLSEGNTINALTALKTAADANPRSLEARLALGTHACHPRIAEGSHGHLQRSPDP